MLYKHQGNVECHIAYYYGRHGVLVMCGGKSFSDTVVVTPFWHHYTTVTRLLRSLQPFYMSTTFFSGNFLKKLV